MSELTIINYGALLIRNGVIEEVGLSRRVEKLKTARDAREIDASGHIVMPAFVDPDIALWLPLDTIGLGVPQNPAREIQLMSRRRMIGRAATLSGEYARYGVLTAGAHTGGVTDLKNTLKLLRTHRHLRLRPLRIRSIFAPHFPAAARDNPAGALNLLTTKWLPTVKKRKLCSVVELTLDDAEGPFDFDMVYNAAVAAAELGFTLRLRSARAPTAQHLEFAFKAGAIGIIAPVEAGARPFADRLQAIGCVRVVPATEAFDKPATAAPAIRNAISEGCAIALSSSYRASGLSSVNPQYLLHMAVHRLGLTIEEAIVATTWNAACTLRLSQVAGSLEPGKSADVLVLDVPDYRELPRRVGHHDVSMVMRTGQVILGHRALTVD